MMSDLPTRGHPAACPAPKSEVNDLGVEQSTLLTRKGFKESRSPQALLGSEKARAYKREPFTTQCESQTLCQSESLLNKEKCLSKVPTLLPGHVMPCALILQSAQVPPPPGSLLRLPKACSPA